MGKSKSFNQAFKNEVGGGLSSLLSGSESQTQPTQAPGQEEKKPKVDPPVNIIIGQTIHKKLKTKCFHEDRKMRDVVEELIVKYYLDPE